MSRLEDKLLLLCARTKADAEMSDRIKVIAGSPDKLDWNYVYQMARRHSVLPLIYTQLSNAAENVPVDQLARFKKNYQDNAARNLWLSAELWGILQSLAAAGIEAVPYKGPAPGSLCVWEFGVATICRPRHPGA